LCGSKRDDQTPLTALHGGQILPIGAPATSHMSTFHVIIMAIVQGITEFLPISSDGHLVVTNALLEAWGQTKTKDLLEVELVLHLGTLAAVLLFYRREIVRVLTTGRRSIVPLVWGTIPAAIIGVGIKKGLPDDVTNSVLGSPLLAGVGFLITAAVLWWGAGRAAGVRRYDELRPAESLFIGLMQALAILPGVSRSGLTIGSGLARDLERESAATYSFMLAIPAIGGAGLLQILEILDAGKTETPLPSLAIGFVVSMVVGLGALALLLRFVKQGKLKVFIYYLIPLGLAVIAWQLSR
jgi:undecaprenyl-diphosphatase